ncbi:MAG: hypothetical protein H0V37_06970, partial [Chloroflexia bacterium]|nr:hypothetical protein [Chloroflexia bacterium]
MTRIHALQRTSPARWQAGLVLAVASLVGLACFLYPFVLPLGNQLDGENTAHARLAPLLFAAVVGVCLVAILVTMADDGGVSRSRTVALLG